MPILLVMSLTEEKYHSVHYHKTCQRQHLSGVKMHDSGVIHCQKKMSHKELVFV